MQAKAEPAGGGALDARVARAVHACRRLYAIALPGSFMVFALYWLLVYPAKTPAQKAHAAATVTAVCCSAARVSSTSCCGVAGASVESSMRTHRQRRGSSCGGAVAAAAAAAAASSSAFMV